MSLFSSSFDFVIFSDKGFKVETEKVVIIRSSCIDSDRSILVEESSFYYVKQTLLIFLGECSSFFSDFRSPVLIGKADFYL